MGARNFHDRRALATTTAFDLQNNKFARASHFCEHFFAVTARLWSKRPLSKLESGPQEINSREIRLHLTFSVNWNKLNRV